MTQVLKDLGVEYVAANPGSSFEGLQESLINYGNPPNHMPEFITILREAPLTNEVALAVSKLKFALRDPADHFLAASAKVFELTLVTADLRLQALRSQGLSILSN